LTGAASETPEETAPATPEVGPLARIPGALFTPIPTFESIARKPTWLAPLVLWIAVSLSFAAVLLPRVDFDRMIRGQLEKRGPVPEERIERIVDRQKSIAPVLYNAMAVVSPAAISLLVALVFWGAFQAFGWQLTFRQSFGATAHAFLPAALGALLFIPVLARQSSVDPRTMGDLLRSNLGFLVDRQSSPAVHSILQSFDVFSFWALALLGIGLSAAARVGRGEAYGLVGALWALFVLGKAGFAALVG
jgi:hypothetical protein